MAEKKNAVVPVYFTPQDLVSRSFNKARHLHLSNSQRDRAIADGTIVVLDEARRIYRSTEQPHTPGFFIASSANGSGAVSMSVPQKIRNLLAAEITGLRAATMS